jgi:hypothetical protein
LKAIKKLLTMSLEFELFSGIDTEKPPVGNPAVAIIVDDGRTLALSRVHLAAEGTEGSSKKLPFAASQKH